MTSAPFLLELRGTNNWPLPWLGKACHMHSMRIPLSSLKSGRLLHISTAVSMQIEISYGGLNE